MDRPQSRAPQCENRLVICAESGNWQQTDGFRGFAGRANPARSITHKRPRGIGCRGDRTAGQEAEPPKPPEQVLPQGRLPAEQMRTARNVENEAVGTIETDQRRVAVAPVGDLLQHHPVGGFVILRDIEIGQAGSRVGKSQSGKKSKLPRAPIRMDETERPSDLGKNNKWPLIRHGAKAGTPQPVGGKPG